MTNQIISLCDSNFPRKALDDKESTIDFSSKTAESSILRPEDAEIDYRLTVCLKCGLYMKGSHANVSYCFSEHMCDSSLTQNQDEYLTAISIIACTMYIVHQQWQFPPKLKTHNIHTEFIDDSSIAVCPFFRTERISN